jgi:hypothetical protein
MLAEQTGECPVSHFHLKTKMPSQVLILTKKNRNSVDKCSPRRENAGTEGEKKWR